MIVEFDAVEKRYGKVHALKDAHLQVPQGSILGLIGPNGAGKTTSMLLMTSLLSRDGGRVRVGGLDPERNPRAVRRHVGYMPDFFGVYEGLTAWEYLEFFAATQNVRKAARPAVVADLLALVDLGHKADADVNTLSRGMKQRLSLARALVHDPELLVLDEPASGLDPRARVELRELIGELHRMGRTIVISSHILSELEGICSHLAIVDHGQILAQDTITAMRQKMMGHRRIVARVAVGHVEDAEDLLRDSSGVEDVSVERDVLHVAFNGDDAVSARLLGSVVDAGIPVAEWRVEAAGLEELFLQVTDGFAEGAAS
ncbi:MAG: ABC transporter ATP-binding protein [Acidimicrobiia bacterium]|nr:ABC transporter ATP-binding protein [Acidimicrobiia bacterium]NNC74885.1 ABC transporter ATP-binding protein [Acidimicrobiia bacterium]